MKQSTAVRLFLLGLPLGLVLTSVASLLWHFRHPPEVSAPSVFTDLAEAIDEAELQNYVRNLSEVIGERHASKPATLERAANYLESTLGPRNIGFEVARQEFLVDGQRASNLWVEIPGGKRLNECVVVVAHYDAASGSKGANDSASAVACLMALAENFVREKPTLTIRLALLANGAEPFIGTDQSGASQFAQLLDKRGDLIRAVLCLDSLGAFPQSPPAFPDWIADYLPSQGPFLSVTSLGNAADLLKESSHQLSRTLGFTVQQGVLLDDSAIQLFDIMGAQPFQAAGFPTLLFAGNGLLAPEDQPVDTERLAAVTRSIATFIRVLSNPKA